MELFDAHTYLGSDPYGDRSATAAALVATMQQHGIGGAAVAPFCESPGPQPGAHEQLAAAVAAHPGRLVGLARVDPRYGERAHDELAYAVTTLGMRGLLFDPAAVRTAPYHPGALRLMDAAIALGLPVIVLCGEGYLGMPEGALRLAELRPQLRLVVGLMGTCVHGTRLIAMARRLPNVWLETSIQQSPQRVRAAVDALGPERVLFGSAYPWSHPRPELQKLAEAALSDAEGRLVLGANARRLFTEAP